MLPLHRLLFDRPLIQMLVEQEERLGLDLLRF